MAACDSTGWMPFGVIDQAVVLKVSRPG